MHYLYAKKKIKYVLFIISINRDIYSNISIALCFWGKYRISADCLQINGLNAAFNTGQKWQLWLDIIQAVFEEFSNNPSEAASFK